MKFYISIHDAAPDNLNEIENIIHSLQNLYGINKICILVIPGLDWNHHQINKLKSWQIKGIEIAAHGWVHKAENIKTLYHKIHSLILSANCAEHLSKKRADVCKIIKKSYDWFIKNGFQKPILYVPPGWALGKIKFEENVSIVLDLSDIDVCSFSRRDSDDTCREGVVNRCYVKSHTSDISSAPR